MTDDFFNDFQESPAKVESEHFDHGLTDSLLQPENTGERQFPWFIDIWLYPVSTSGMTNLGIFLAYVFGIGLLGRYGLAIRFSFGFILGLYFCWYLIECVRDSSDGGVRAPNVIASRGDDLGGMFSTYGYFIASYLICFGPMVGYSLYAPKHDAIYWSLVAYAAFLFPMLFLAIITLEDGSALNPIFLIWSMIKTLPWYAITVAVFGGFILLLHCLPVITNPVLSFLSGVVMFYMFFVGSHLLGRFYWLNRERLGW